MDPVYTLDPFKWVAYVPPVLCPLCGLPSSNGTHQQIIEHADGSLAWGCRVPMIIHNPKSCGMITGITF